MLKPVILSASILALTLSLAPVKDASAYWGTYQHDAQQTGKADKAAPSAPSVKWSYQHPNVVDPIAGWVYDPAFVAGVAEGADGTIHAAGADGRAYATVASSTFSTVLVSAAPHRLSARTVPFILPVTASGRSIPISRSGSIFPMATPVAGRSRWARMAPSCWVKGSCTPSTRQT